MRSFNSAIDQIREVAEAFIIVAQDYRRDKLYAAFEVESMTDGEVVVRIQQPESR